jgi:hypothetical protein
MRVWFLQPAIAPYRIPLFGAIARAPGIDLTVVVQAERLAGHPWEIDLASLPFKVLRVPSLTLRRDFEREAFASPALIRHFFRQRKDRFGPTSGRSPSSTRYRRFISKGSSRRIASRPTMRSPISSSC